MNYNYKGKDKIAVKVILFNGLPDYVFSLEQWVDEGGYRGLVKSGAIPINYIQKVIDGTMSQKDFYSLEAWEG